MKLADITYKLTQEAELIKQQPTDREIKIAEKLYCKIHKKIRHIALKGKYYFDYHIYRYDPNGNILRLVINSLKSEGFNVTDISYVLSWGAGTLLQIGWHKSDD